MSGVKTTRVKNGAMSGAVSLMARAKVKQEGVKWSERGLS
jgi:hypothetical protein